VRGAALNRTPKLTSPVTDIVLWERPDGGRSSLYLRGWQWGFGAIAPLALIVIDLRLFGGWLLSFAPATFWAVAILAPIILAVSQKRWGGTFDLVLSGMVVSAAALALSAALMPVLIFVGVSALNGLSPTGQDFLLGLVLISSLSLLFMWPLYFCFSAFRRQARIRLKRRKDYRTSATLFGMALLPLALIAVEAGDRIWFGSMVNKLRSSEAAVVLEGASQLQIYPIGLMTRTEDVCAPLFAQAPDSFVSADSLDNQLGWAWGRDAQKVRAAARKLFGANAPRVCAEALSSD
jgi:hypothetical protein